MDAAVRLLKDLDLKYVVDAEGGILVVPKESVRAFITRVKDGFMEREEAELPATVE